MKALKKIWQTVKKRIKTKWIMLEQEQQEAWIIVGRVVAIIVLGIIILTVWVIF